MKQVVLSLQESDEKLLRSLAQRHKGGRKGALSETVSEALRLLGKQLRQREALLRLKELADRDLVMGVGRFDRKELYE